MISQNVAERSLNITSILNNYKSFIKQVYQQNGRKILKRSRIKIITSEQETAKRWKKHLKKKSRLTFENSKNLLFYWNPIFIKVNLQTFIHIYPKRNWQLFLILTHWSYSKWKYILQTQIVYKIPTKEHHVVDRWHAHEISVF